MKDTAKKIPTPTAQKKDEPFFTLQRNGIFSSSSDTLNKVSTEDEINPKLEIGKRDDMYEKEADNMADKVVSSKHMDDQVNKRNDHEVNRNQTNHTPIINNASRLKCDCCQIRQIVQKIDDNDQENNSDEAPALYSSITSNGEDDIGRSCTECEDVERINRLIADDTIISGQSKRELIVSFARSMVGRIKARQSFGSDNELALRNGGDLLWEIFKLSAPDVWPEDVVKYNKPGLPHWCGIFTGWVYKKAGIPVPDWKPGIGILGSSIFTPTDYPRKGDIGYIDQPYQHHNIIVGVNGDMIHTIDGNSGVSSEVIEKISPVSYFSGFYTASAADESTSFQKKALNTASQGIDEKVTANEPISLESELQSEKGKGSPMQSEVRASMENSFNADFGNVRIHANQKASNLCKNLNALAFAHGNDIYFKENNYNPASSDGKRLLAHELTHTVQQGKSIQRKQVPSLQKDDKNPIPNYLIVINFKGEIVWITPVLSEDTLARLQSNSDSNALLLKRIEDILYPGDYAVYETPTFLKSNLIRKLLTKDIEAWSGYGEPKMLNFFQLIDKRTKAVQNTYILSKLEKYLMDTYSIDGSFIDWNVVLPKMYDDLFTWIPKSIMDAGDYDQYEWTLDLLNDEVSEFQSVHGALQLNIIDLNKKVFNFTLDNKQLFTEDVMRSHSEKFLYFWTGKLKGLKFMPDNFALDDFKPAIDEKEIEKKREGILSEFIKFDVPDLIIKYVLDQWTISGLAPDVWLENLNIDTYKSDLLDHLVTQFLKNADESPEYKAALIQATFEKTKFDLIRQIYFIAWTNQQNNQSMQDKFTNNDFQDLGEVYHAIAENPVEYYDISTKMSDACYQFLYNIQTNRSIGNEYLIAIDKVVKAIEAPPVLGGLILLVDMGIHLNNFKKTIEQERSKIKEILRRRIEVDYNRIAEIIKNWVEYADEFIETKWKPMLKEVALDMLKENRDKIEDILANYDQAKDNYANKMFEGAYDLKLLIYDLEDGYYDEIEYDGKIVTRDDLHYLWDAYEFMMDEGDRSLNSKISKDEKDKLTQALADFDRVKKDLDNDKYHWLDYSKEVYVEARKRLGISIFPPYTTIGQVLNSEITADKNPFLAKVIVNWHWKERIERDVNNGLLLVGLGILSIAAMLVPGVGGLVIGAIDIAVGIGMGVNNVFDAQAIVRMARLDIHHDIRGIPLDQAEKALKHAWIGLGVTVVLTAGPLALSRALKVRSGGIRLDSKTRGWERGLNLETRQALLVNKSARGLYASMSSKVRKVLTLCASTCIPLKYLPSEQEILRLQKLMDRIDVPPTHRGLREYLHHPSRRRNLTPAIDAIEDAKSLKDLQKRLDSAIIKGSKGPGTPSKVDGLWHFKKPDNTIVKEYTTGSHTTMKNSENATNSFFQSHHGIQDKWAKDMGISGYSRGECPAILIRDSHMGSPHQTVNALQTARKSGRATRTYADERSLLLSDLKKAGVPNEKATSLLSESDTYFSKLYRNIEATGDTAALTRIFGDWKP